MIKRQFLALLLIFLLPLAMLCQIKPAEWLLYEDVNGIQIFYKYQNCDIIEEGIHQELVLLRFVNTSNIKMQIQWTVEQVYSNNDIPKQISDSEFSFSLTMDAGELIEGDCNLNCLKSLRIFSKFLNYSDKPELTEFKLGSFKTNPI